MAETSKWREKIANLKDRKADAQTMGVVTKSQSTMPQEKWMRQRIASLLQGGSFTEVGH